MPTVNRVIAEVRKENPRSAWGKGVKKYAMELMDDVKEWKGGSFELTTTNYKKIILNGAKDWKEYSWGGSSAAYILEFGCGVREAFNEDIAKRLSTKSELVQTRNGMLRPNAREEWLDTQARALFQADGMIRSAIISASIEKKTVKKKTTRRS